jgi:hypothetical protein
MYVACAGRYNQNIDASLLPHSIMMKLLANVVGNSRNFIPNLPVASFVMGVTMLLGHSR